jgi:hypothetical protein
MRARALHEDFDRKGATAVHSERSFGLVFAAVFLIIALWPLISWHAPRYWALALSAAFGGLALTLPALLRPLNLLWFRIGLALHRVMSVVILAMLFFVTVAPIGFIYRLLGKDPLRLKLDRGAGSYWIAREPPGPPPDSMANQF